MAKSIFLAAPSNASDALFRAWGKALSDAMTEVGFTKTADTGQIDWSSVLAPAAISTYQGYEIRAFSDSLQATNPVYLKIEYGSSSPSAGIPGIRYTIGKATDGAGELVGEYYSFVSGVYNAASATLYYCVVSGDTDRIQLSMFVGTTNPLMLSIERLKDSSGNNIDDGVDIFWTSCIAGSASNRTYPYQFFWPLKGIQYPYTVAAGLCSSVPYSGSASYAGNVGLFPIFPAVGYNSNPDLGILIYDSATINSLGSIMTVELYGDNHDYLITGATSTTAFNGSALTSWALAMRCE